MKDWKSLLRESSLKQLLDNHRKQLPLRGTRGELDLRPVAKLVNLTGAGVWLLTECDEDGLAFGLADLGAPEIGYISMEEITAFQGRTGLGIEEDRRWVATKTLSQYAAEARAAGYIHA